MAQSKCNCPSCRRLIEIQLQFCPYCRNENPFYQPVQEPAKIVEPAAAKTAQVTKPNVVQKQYEPISESEFDEADSDQADETTSAPSDDDSQEIYIEEPEDVEESLSLEDEYSDPDELEDTENNDNGSNTNNINSKKSHSGIKWRDEKPKPDVDRSAMFDENGNYNANYDGYYNDTLPKIQNEVDRLLANKEKTILKVVACIVGIAGIIVYLVLTL